MLCSICKTDVPRVMRCGACNSDVCRWCKVAPSVSDAPFGLGFGAFCSVECRDGQEVRAALAAEPCPTCGGNPPKKPPHAKDWESACKSCYDTGIHFPAAGEDTPEKRRFAQLRKDHPCPVCQARWEANTTTCTTCRGSGIDLDVLEKVSEMADPKDDDSHVEF